MFRKSVVALSVFVLLGGNLVGCGSSEKKQALEQEKAQQEKVQQEKAQQEKVRQKKYCDAVRNFSELGQKGSDYEFAKLDTIGSLATQMYINAPAEDRAKLKSNVDTLNREIERSKEVWDQGGFWAGLAGSAAQIALLTSEDHPANRAYVELSDYASSHRCDNVRVR